MLPAVEPLLISDRRGHAIALAAVTALSAKEPCGSPTSGGQKRAAWASSSRSLPELVS